jgi:hypothetical protein
MKTEREVSTKPNARGESVTTKVTFDWEGMTEEDIRALAEQALTVKWQGQRRADAEKNGTPIPTVAEVKVIEHKVGSRAPRKPADVLALVRSGALTDAQKAELRALLAG